MFCPFIPGHARKHLALVASSEAFLSAVSQGLQVLLGSTVVQRDLRLFARPYRVSGSVSVSFEEESSYTQGTLRKTEVKLMIPEVLMVYTT